MSGSPSDLAIDRSPGGVRFFIHVTPRARTTQVGPAHAEALRVRITAPPVQGRANAACRDALASTLGVGRSDVEIDPGSRGRRKRVFVAGDSDELTTRLLELAAETALG